MQAAIQALTHPDRRQILRLVAHQALPVGELAQHLGVSQPATSQHLKVLRDAGLVHHSRTDGRRRLYQVDLDGLQRLRAELDQLWEPALAALKHAAEGGDRP